MILVLCALLVAEQLEAFCVPENCISLQKKEVHLLSLVNGK